jgi:protein-tyrosine-phosphatase/predicted ATP-grasp superfamily ATP-dependent carboligase
MASNSKYQPVLILGAAPRISVAIARSLHRHGIPVEVASFWATEPKLRSRAIRSFHRLPRKDLHPAKFLDSLLALVRERGFDMVMAAGDPALSALAEHYDQISPLLHVGCPRPAIIERVLNKALTLEAAQKCGIQVPFTCTVANATELEQVAAQLRFPVVVKPGQKGAQVFRVRCFPTLEMLSEALRMNDPGPVLLQEYCPGLGVGVEMLLHKGECVAAFQHRRLKEAPASGGVAAMAIAESLDPALAEASLKLLRALEWEGPAMVEFRVDRETGSCVLMEVNGRYWGTSSLPILAGVDFPLYHWQILHGEQPCVPGEYAIGMRWRWTPGYLDRLYSIVAGSSGKIISKTSRIRELVHIPIDFLPTIREALWSWSDPEPFFSELAASMYEHVSAAVNWLLRKLTRGGPSRYAKIYLRLRPGARSTYARLRTADALGANRKYSQAIPGSMRSVLFVCYGNIMRSPMAEAMLKLVLAEQGVNGVGVQSAGLHALTGRKAHPLALKVSREMGIPLDNQRARLLTPEMVASSDLIFAMDFENLAELGAAYPDAKNKIHMLSAFAEGKQRNREIADPYYGGEETTRQCYAVLMQCVRNLAQSVFPARETAAAVDSTPVHH